MPGSVRGVEPVVPTTVARELAGALAYYDYKERCVFCDVIQQDTADHNGRRVVAMNDRFLAIGSEQGVVYVLKCEE